MGQFTVMPQDTFDELQLDAGVLLSSFNPASPSVVDANIICATTGGINAVCQPTYSDFGEDVDNCPANMKEMKHLDSWTCTLGFTALGTSAENIKLALGAADVTSNLIQPRRDLSQDDFEDAIWWVGDRADGGFVAVKLLNALSTNGLSIQTTKNGKGQTSVTLTGHFSINAQSTVPMAFYSYEGTGTDDYTYLAVTPAGTENPAVCGWYERSGTDPDYVYSPTVDTEVDAGTTYYIRTVPAEE